MNTQAAPPVSTGDGPAVPFPTGDEARRGPAPATRGAAHRRPPRRAVVGTLLLVLGLAAWLATQQWMAAQPVPPLSASGTIEADEILVAPEVAGRLVALQAEEGRSVKAGDVLARIDDSLLQVQLRQADAATRQQLEVQAERYVLRSPIVGVLTRVPVRLGEVVSPGQTVVAVANLAFLKLTLYVLERDLGRVRTGQTVQVTADPYPGRAFAGAVTSVNSRAEFTPRNVQTQRDRVNLVFGVKVRVDNRDGALKPGMPVDATFEPLP